MITIVAIGAPYNGIDRGHVRIFENISGSCVQIGQDIDGEATGNAFGTSVAMDSSGTIIAASAYLNDGAANDVFKSNNTNINLLSSYAASSRV